MLKHGDKEKVPFMNDLLTLIPPDMPHSVWRKLSRILLTLSIFMTMWRNRDSAGDWAFDLEFSFNLSDTYSYSIYLSFLLLLVDGGVIYLHPRTCFFHRIWHLEAFRCPATLTWNHLRTDHPSWCVTSTLTIYRTVHQTIVNGGLTSLFAWPVEGFHVEDACLVRS